MITIRKFGLEYCDLPTMLWNVTVLWRPLTINIDKRDTRRIPIIFYIMAIIIFLGYFYVYVISMVYFVFIKCRENGDIVAATVIFSLAVTSQIGPWKLVFMLLNKKTIRDLVETCFKCNSAEISMSRFAGNIKKTLRTVKKRAIVFWLVIVFDGIVYWVKPIILPGRNLMEDNFDYYGLEPMYESPNYEIAMCVTTFGIFFTVYLTSNITALFIVLTGYVEAQMLALSEEIIYLWEDAQKYAATKSVTATNGIRYNKIINDYVGRNLKQIVKIHTVNINIVGQIELVTRGGTAMEFILLTISMVGALLGGLENTYIEVPFSLIQVAMDCLVGQRLMDASILFENAVYDSKWENFDKSNMKTVLLILQNSQRTLALSAGGVTVLSFTSLSLVLKSIYSTYTGLRSTVQKDHYN